MADASLWDEVVGALREFGPAQFADLSLDDSINAMARRAVASAPPEFVLVAFSMGGYVAREIARLAPERVRALVLIATSARGDTPEQTRRKSAAVAQVASGQFKGLSRTSIVSSIHRRRVSDESLIERIRAMGERLGRDVFVRQSSLRRESDTASLAVITCPTLVIAAPDDQLRTVEEAMELQSGIPGASLELVAGSGHMVPLEVPGALADLLCTWLKPRLAPA